MLKKSLVAQKCSMGRIDYISGDYDSRNAPWNERYCTCPRCNGAGKLYYKWDAKRRTDVPITAQEWNCLPEIIDDDSFDGRGDVENCPMCDGSGKTLY